MTAETALQRALAAELPEQARPADDDRLSWATPGKPAALTLGELRAMVAELPDSTTLRVGIRDTHHVNTFLGMLPVRGVSIHPSAGEGTVILVDVPGVS